MRRGKSPQNINEELNKMRRLMNFDISQNSHDVLSEHNIRKSVLKEQYDPTNPPQTPSEWNRKLNNQINALIEKRAAEAGEKIKVSFRYDDVKGFTMTIDGTFVNDYAFKPMKNYGGVLRPFISLNSFDYAYYTPEGMKTGKGIKIPIENNFWDELKDKQEWKTLIEQKGEDDPVIQFFINKMKGGYSVILLPAGNDANRLSGWYFNYGKNPKYHKKLVNHYNKELKKIDKLNKKREKKEEKPIDPDILNISDIDNIDSKFILGNITPLNQENTLREQIIIMKNSYSGRLGGENIKYKLIVDYISLPTELEDAWKINVDGEKCTCTNVKTKEEVEYPCDGPLPPECKKENIFTPIEIVLDLVDAYEFDKVENDDGTSWWTEDDKGKQFKKFIDSYAATKETYSMVWDDYLEFLRGKGVIVEGYASIDDDEDENMRGEYKNCNIDKQLSSDSKKQPRRDYNICLSKKRAQQVIKDIVSIYPELDGILIPKGMGATDKFNGKKWPETTNEKETAPNRRVKAVFPVYDTQIKVD